jgi:hypothetical protein
MIMQNRIAVVQFASTWSRPTFKHIISDDRRRIFGMTSIDNRLFLVRSPSRKQIQVFDTHEFKLQQVLEVEDLNDDLWDYSGLTSCVTNNCLYVSDTVEKTVYKVELSGNNQVFGWQVDGWPRGLSTNTSHNLLTVCCWTNKILEYTTTGSLIRKIRLKANDVISFPHHAIQLTSDQFAVCCSNDVVEVDTEGRVVVSYKNQLQSSTQRKFNFLHRLDLAVDENNDFVFVADTYNNRNMIVNRSLDCCGAHKFSIMSVGGKLKLPSCLHFDTSQNRLFFGQWHGQCLVLMFNNVNQHRVQFSMNFL